MNKQRRTRLEKLIAQLEDIQVELQDISTEERDAYDNLPDSLQDTERGQQMEENADNLDYADSDFENLLDSLREIAEG